MRLKIPGKEFRKCKRFGQVIVSSDLEGSHPVADASSRAQDKNGSIDPVVSELLQEFQTIHRGRSDIHYYNVK